MGLSFDRYAILLRAAGEVRMEDFEQARREMVELLRGTYGISDNRVLEVMAKVPRHLFIPELLRGADAYGDHPCPIGFGQTVSQPYIVAFMTQALAVRSGEKVLEIGTGSGYQAAVLAALGARVLSIERIPELAEHARSVLGEQAIVRCGDGTEGWPGEAPFDVIIGTCAPDDVPPALPVQLAEGGRMLLPVGRVIQKLVFFRKEHGGIIRTDSLPVRFVPMVQGAV